MAVQVVGQLLGVVRGAADVAGAAPAQHVQPEQVHAGRAVDDAAVVADPTPWSSTGTSSHE